MFSFLYDRNQPDTLHITVRHGTDPLEAIGTFFEGETTWNEERKRFETMTATHGIYWARVPEDEGVLVISCFRPGDSSGKEQD